MSEHCAKCSQEIAPCMGRAPRWTWKGREVCSDCEAVLRFEWQWGRHPFVECIDTIGTVP